MNLRWPVLAVAALCGSSVGAAAADTVGQVRASGVLHCGAVPRPGLFETGADGRVGGLLADLCRAVAAALQPSAIKIVFHPYNSAAAFDAIRNGQSDVAFLTGSEIVAEKLAGAAVPGPTVFFQTTSVMVPRQSPLRSLQDLAGQPVCSQDGGSAQRHLEAWFAARRRAFVRMAFREEGEMVDAYNVQACRALAAETTALAALRRDAGVNHLNSRILPDALDTFPIFVVTPTQDARWSAAVAWVVHTLVRAEVPRRPWTAGGIDALPVDAPELGLVRGWQARVVAAVGSYGDIFSRSLGDRSPYHLPRGANAQASDGGLMLAPFDE